MKDICLGKEWGDIGRQRRERISKCVRRGKTADKKWTEERASRKWGMR